VEEWMDVSEMGVLDDECKHADTEKVGRLGDFAGEGRETTVRRENDHFGAMESGTGISVDRLPDWLVTVSPNDNVRRGT
jgi:hypothetical protein